MVGKPTGIQELVWVNLNKLPANVSVLIFVVAAYSGGFLEDVKDGRSHVFEEREVRKTWMDEAGDGVEQLELEEDLSARETRSGETIHDPHPNVPSCAEQAPLGLGSPEELGQGKAQLRPVGPVGTVAACCKDRPVGIKTP
ncbi:unnamed protein product [Durusdinium trenchii]|uniref:Uncharacterized protein n=1 Tax=Durusdinium trenchii TaxID=1381693 RepID=A0ABP0H5X5_9DINO